MTYIAMMGSNELPKNAVCVLKKSLGFFVVKEMISNGICCMLTFSRESSGPESNKRGGFIGLH
jgi:hypothetical protein